MDENLIEIVNLTQHLATEEQKKAGVSDLDRTNREKLIALLTFMTLPTKEEIQRRAKSIADLVVREGVARCTCGVCWLCENHNGLPYYALIGGAPFLMSQLERELKERGIAPLYAFSRRESIEKVDGDKVVKTQVFRHLGFVEVE